MVTCPPLTTGFGLMVFVICRSQNGVGVEVGVGVGVGVEVEVEVGVGVATGLHFPEVPALKMLLTSCLLRARLKSSTSSILPL